MDRLVGWDFVLLIKSDCFFEQKNEMRESDGIVFPCIVPSCSIEGEHGKDSNYPRLKVSVVLKFLPFFFLLERLSWRTQTRTYHSGGTI